MTTSFPESSDSPPSSESSEFPDSWSILVVDDEPAILDVTRFALKSMRVDGQSVLMDTAMSQR